MQSKLGKTNGRGMMPIIIACLLIAAGAALVAQNVLMAKISGAVSSILVALAMNSAVGVTVFLILLAGKNGIGFLNELAGIFRHWFLIPGLLGSFSIFSSILGYQRLGAASTVSIIVASQLLFGLLYDLSRSDKISLQNTLSSAVGAVLLVTGAILIVSRYRH